MALICLAEFISCPERAKKFVLMPWMAAASQFVSLVVIFYTLGKAVCEGGVCTNVLRCS